MRSKNSAFLSIRISKKLRVEIEEMVEENDTTFSEVVRYALQKLINKTNE